MAIYLVSRIPSEKVTKKVFADVAFLLPNTWLEKTGKSCTYNFRTSSGKTVSTRVSPSVWARHVAGAVLHVARYETVDGTYVSFANECVSDVVLLETDRTPPEDIVLKDVTKSPLFGMYSLFLNVTEFEKS